MPYNSELSELIADVSEQVLFLQELGVDAFEIEFPEKASLFSSVNSLMLEIDSSRSPETRSDPPAKIISAGKVNQLRQPGSRLASLPSLALRNRNTIPSSVSHEATENRNPHEMMKSRIAESIEAEQQLIEISPKLEETADTIESIRAEIGNCTRCKLNTGRTQIVHTNGNFQAELMFVGEAPGADEDEQGFPFVGRAGQLLTKIIESIGMKREEVCIGNINRCRPPGNRQPEPDETAQCRPFLIREIAVVKPKVIVVLGATAAHNLLQVKTPISKLRGHFHDYFGVKVMPTFHPAYLLRDPHKKREVWEDMKMVREFLN